jgi:hypothetical protein
VSGTRVEEHQKGDQREARKILCTFKKNELEYLKGM